MADKKGSVIIIKKKKGGGHAAAHGGAWKVAYADFVTAMMCFFLVMWLMGSDEQTKAEITHYFNHPNTPWRFGGDPDSNMARPMGEKKGSGNNLLNGMGGANPDDLVPNPTRPMKGDDRSRNDIPDKEHPDNDDQIGAVAMEIESMKFTLLDENLFEPGSTRFKPDADRYLKRLHDLVLGFTGTVRITGYAGPYELSTAKAVAVMKHMVERRWITEDRVKPRGLASVTNPDSPGFGAPKKLEFSLSR